MKRVDAKFKRRVYELVASIPKGRVMTYGQVAALCGAAWAAWEVGQIAHHGPQYIHIARGYTTGGLEAHKRDLEAEGVSVTDEYKVDIEELLWWPQAKGQNSLPL